MIESIIEFAKDNTALFIGIITASIAVLSTVLALLEYFEKKAYCDYFFIEDYARDGCRSGFHPEYLSFAVLVFCCFFAAYILISSILPFANRFVVIALIIVIPTVFSFCISALIYWLYHDPQKDEMCCRTAKELRKTSIKFALLKAAKWFSVSILFSSGYWIYTEMNDVTVILFFIVVCIYVYIKFGYECNKEILKNEIRFFNIIKCGNKSYAILNTHNGFHYCVRIKMNSENVNLYLDRVKIFNACDSDISIKRKYIKSFNRILNNKKVQDNQKLGIKRRRK